MPNKVASFFVNGAVIVFLCQWKYQSSSYFHSHFYMASVFSDRID
jgi:hypothetical protein